MTSALDITESARPHRAVFVNFHLGHQTGSPGQPDLRCAINRDAFRPLETVTEPGTVVTLPYVWDESDSNWEGREYRQGYLQPFGRKISGYHAPSQANRRAFDVAQDEVTAAVRGLCRYLTTPGRPPTA